LIAGQLEERDMTDRGSPSATHAGAVVYRGSEHAPEFLLIGASANPQERVLPKGHIERGEAPASAAVREVLEEAGVSAGLVDETPLGTVWYRVGSREVRVLYYLARRLGDGRRHEDRSIVWLPADQAEASAAHQETKEMIRRARARLSSMAPGGNE
jgi:8-oxo-dGTP pyrophosphatase MutT (NUDIX family)